MYIGPCTFRGIVHNITILQQQLKCRPYTYTYNVTNLLGLSVGKLRLNDILNKSHKLDGDMVSHQIEFL